LKKEKVLTLAVLVLAYREPVVLSLVAPIYRQAGFDVYIHLDAKASLEDYKRAMGDEAGFHHFIDGRECVFWAGWSMMRATFNLMNAAASAGQYQNFLLVSDDTLPIARADRLRAMLKMPVERISARPVRNDEVFADRYRRFFFLDHPATSLHGRPIESSFADDAFFSAVARLHERQRLGKVQVPLNYGAQWWCLTADAIQAVLALHEKRIDLRESFEFSAVPDEMYIQTIVANFARKNRIVGGPVYVDWSRQKRPHIFSDFSFERAVINDHFFVRKVSALNREFIEEALCKIT
jgi:hypothetical protein